MNNNQPFIKSFITMLNSQKLISKSVLNDTTLTHNHHLTPVNTDYHETEIIPYLKKLFKNKFSNKVEYQIQPSNLNGVLIIDTRQNLYNHIETIPAMKTRLYLHLNGHIANLCNKSYNQNIKPETRLTNSVLVQTNHDYYTGLFDRLNYEWKNDLNINIRIDTDNQFTQRLRKKHINYRSNTLPDNKNNFNRSQYINPKLFNTTKYLLLPEDVIYLTDDLIDRIKQIWQNNEALYRASDLDAYPDKGITKLYD